MPPTIQENLVVMARRGLSLLKRFLTIATGVSIAFLVLRISDIFLSMLDLKASIVCCAIISVLILVLDHLDPLKESESVQHTRTPTQQHVTTQTENRPVRNLRVLARPRQDEWQDVDDEVDDESDDEDSEEELQGGTRITAVQPFERMVRGRRTRGYVMFPRRWG